MLTQAPRGTKDVLPQDSYRWQHVEAKMREAAALAGYREVRTPVFEHTELFLRGVGDTTDIVTAPAAGRGQTPSAHPGESFFLGAASVKAALTTPYPAISAIANASLMVSLLMVLTLLSGRPPCRPSPRTQWRQKFYRKIAGFFRGMFFDIRTRGIFCRRPEFLV